MKTAAINKTQLLKSYLDEKKDFIKYEEFEDCYIIYYRDETQLFWFGVGYGKYIEDAKNQIG